MAPTVIKWTDPNVPVLSGRIGAFIDILDYSLPQRGWQKLFSGTGKAVYLAGSGDKKCYRVLNDDTLNYYAACTHAKITAYDSMVDVDTGVGKWADEKYFALTVGGTAPRPWVIVFDDVSVLFITIPNKTTGDALANVFCQLHGFGETVPALPGIIPRSFVGGHGWNSPEHNFCALSCPGRYNNQYGTIACSRSLDGARTGVAVGQFLNGGFSGIEGATHHPFGSGYIDKYLPYPFAGKMIYGRPLLDDGVANGFGYDHIPFLFYPCHFRSSFQNLQPYTDSDANEFIAVYLIALTTTLSWSGNWDINAGAALIKIS